MTDETEKPKEYKPTRAEEKILEIMLNPDHRYKKQREVAELAGCDRSQITRAFRKPGFVEYYRKESRALVVRSLAPVINAQIKEAIAGSTPAAKLVLTMAGEYSEKTDITFPDKNGDPQDISGGVVFYMPSNGRDETPVGGKDGE